tara:strand:- start:632 stop:829 length:198 start_codon:yes stop_codon:yes gene_type:complete
MSRKITLNIEGVSSKQYSTLVLELNLMAKKWNRYGVDITLPRQQKIIRWGNKRLKDEHIPAENPH